SGALGRGDAHAGPRLGDGAHGDRTGHPADRLASDRVCRALWADRSGSDSWTPLSKLTAASRDARRKLWLIPSLGKRPFLTSGHGSGIISLYSVLSTRPPGTLVTPLGFSILPSVRIGVRLGLA